MRDALSSSGCYYDGAGNGQCEVDDDGSKETHSRPGARQDTQTLACCGQVTCNSLVS